MNRLVRGLTSNRAETDPRADDRRLRGRTYAIPFDRVWQCTLNLVDGGLRGWRLVHADDQEGLIRAVRRTLVFRLLDDVQIVIGLDDNAQTRVDVKSRARKGKADLGRNPRGIARFLKRLDRKLEADPTQILDATRTPSWTHPA